MSKPYTSEALGYALSEDRVWRLRELSDLKTAIQRADRIGRPVLLRSLVTITYAHWEGYVRLAARAYLEHVSLRNLRYDELTPQFLKNYFIPRLGAIRSSKHSVAERCRLVDEILQAGSLRFRKVDPSIVNTRSNLNSEVIHDICLVCDIDPQPFDDESNFIDKILLERRNAIAHGENAFIDVDAIDEVVETAVNLMRIFADALENAAARSSYRLPASNKASMQPP